MWDVDREALNMQQQAVSAVCLLMEGSNLTVKHFRTSVFLFLLGRYELFMKYYKNHDWIFPWAVKL